MKWKHKLNLYVIVFQIALNYVLIISSIPNLSPFINFLALPVFTYWIFVLLFQTLWKNEGDN